MALNKQMELFDDGGLMDEGGSVDPVSGNDVPSGSTQEEVRDDIPAQLSEGEFVLPADVVRYHGLEKIMKLRDEAKFGLQKMEDMGQMGNSEEAVLEDDVPFSIEDLDMEDNDEYNKQEFNQGGVVQPQGFTGIGGYQPSQFANYVPQYMPYQPNQQQQLFQQQQPQQQQYQPYQPVIQQAVPQMQQQQTPSFKNFISTPQGSYEELREYRNPTTGEIRSIPFVGGNPIYPIPEGFVYQDPEAITTEQVTTTPTTPQSTTVRDTDRFGDGDGDGDPTGGPVGPGTAGTAQFGGDLQEDGTVKNSTTLSISFSIPGSIPGIIGGLMSSAQMSMQGLPENAIMHVQNPNVKNSVTLDVPATMANASVIGPDSSVSSETSQEIVDLINEMNDLGYGGNTMSVETAQSISDAAAEGMLGSETGKGSGPTAGKRGGTGRGRSDVDVSPSATAAGNQSQSQGLPGNADGSMGTDSGVSQADAEAAMGTEPFGGDGGGSSSSSSGGGSSSSGSGTGSSNPADVGYSKGGLTKQMKQSGLASKK